MPRSGIKSIGRILPPTVKSLGLPDCSLPDPARSTSQWRWIKLVRHVLPRCPQLARRTGPIFSAPSTTGQCSNR